MGGSETRPYVRVRGLQVATKWIRAWIPAPYQVRGGLFAGVTEVLPKGLPEAGEDS